MKKKFLVLPFVLTLLSVGCSSETSTNPSTEKIDVSSKASDSSTKEVSSSKEITSSSGEKGDASSSLPSSSAIKKSDFTGVTFESLTFSYDGNAHILGEVKGAPEGTKITYTGRSSYTNAGTYKATAKLEKENYNDKTLEATLTINPIDFSGFAYESVSVTYDGKDHIQDVKLTGNQPEGTTVKETVTNSGGDVVLTAVEVGTYSYTVEITNSNYKKLTLTATLTIKAAKSAMPVFVADDGTVYFANGLHNKYLYSLSSENTLKQLDYSSPKEFNKYSSSTALFISGTTIMNSVKKVSNNSSSVVYTDSNIDDFVEYSSSVYYYSSNSLTASKSGIYKVDATNSGDEPIVTKVFEGKTDNLAICGSNLYFTNGNDHNYIYKMNLSTNVTSLVLSEKTHEFIIKGNKLYCTVNGTVNDYIGYLDLSSTSTTPTKLTNAAGEGLTIRNEYLYYNYTDLFGMIDDSKYGIWSINLTTNEEKQILPGNGVNGFDVESSGNIVYIDTADLHLYRYNTTSKAKTDLLNGFVAPETTPLNTGGHSISYGTKVYYLNMYAGKTLYVYDETTKKNYQLSTNKVTDFYIYGDVLYFNQVTMLTNNDLYSVNLKVSSEATKISTNDVRNMVSDGTYIYATHYNWAGAAGGISRMKLDGTEYVKFSDINGAKNLTIKDNKLYYINSTGDNGNIEYFDLSTIQSDSTDLKGTNLDKKIKNVKQFIFDGDNIYYSYDGTIENSIRRTSFTNLGEGTKIASTKTNPNEMILWGDSIVYYSYAVSATSSAGFYKVSKNATSDEGGKEENLLLSCDSKYYGSDFAISSSDRLYFLNYITSYALGDAHTYQLDLNTKAVKKII